MTKKKEKTMEYSIIIHKDEKSGWYVGKCVQLPAAMSQGETLEQLLDNMKDAISLVLEYNKEKAMNAFSGDKVFYRKVAFA